MPSVFASAEDQFLEKLARGFNIEQDEYDQMREYLPPELIAAALVRRYSYTEDMRSLVEAARLYSHAGFDYEALEICSRFPRVYELKKLIEKTLPRVRQDYPGIPCVGKLLEEAFLVIDLNTGKISRFPPLIPATVLETP